MRLLQAFGCSMAGAVNRGDMFISVHHLESWGRFAVGLMCCRYTVVFLYVYEQSGMSKSGALGGRRDWASSAMLLMVAVSRGASSKRLDWWFSTGFSRRERRGCGSEDVIFGEVDEDVESSAVR